MKIIDVPQTGKKGIIVAMPSRYGQIIRTLAIPTNPRSEDQMAVRARLSKYSKAWRALTPAQRESWITAASKINTVPVLGQYGTLTGIQHFVRTNCNLEIMGASRVSEPSMPVAFPTLVPSALEITNTIGVIKVSLVCGDDPNEYTAVWAAAPCSQGKSITTGYRLLGACPMPALGKSDITSMVVAKFGTLTAGTKLFVKANQMIAGFTDLPHLWSAIIPTAQ